jgi:hypothetical protein
LVKLERICLDIVLVVLPAWWWIIRGWARCLP